MDTDQVGFYGFMGFIGGHRIMVFYDIKLRGTIMQDKMIKFSTNVQWRGKPEKTIDVDGKQIFLFNGKKVYIGYNWQYHQVLFSELFEVVAIMGLPIAPALIDGADGHKTDTNFLSHSLAMVDIDSGMTIEELLQDEFYKDFGSGFYTTPSHTKENHRFRIIFVLESDITVASDMCLLYRWLFTHYKNADVSCKNATRLFYGTLNAARSEMTDRYLPAKFIRDAIALQALNEAEERAKFKSSFSNNTEVGYGGELSSEKRAKILELLLTMPAIGHGSHNKFLAIGWGLQSAGYSLHDFMMVTRQLFSHKGEDLCRALWDKPPTGGSNLGAIINLIKSHYGSDCLWGY